MSSRGGGGSSRGGDGGSKKTPHAASRNSPGARANETPSREAWAALGPYARTRLTVHALGKSLPLEVPADVFSTQRIDEGTQLLLAHLPAGEPRSILDLGCGYGALGLPVAAKFPSCRSLLVDRDLLAVAASSLNARTLNLANVEARPSLGFRDLPDPRERFDWLLCNVPARIGALAIGHFLEGGRALLQPGGELRVVVIRDLVSPLREAAKARGLEQDGALREIVHGPRHSVFALPANEKENVSLASHSITEANSPSAAVPAAGEDPEAIYARDLSFLPVPHGPRAPGISIARPHDASEDPRHADALALLFSALPRADPKRAFAFRCGFGGAALAGLLLWPAARVVAQERDLLDAAFLERNARALSVADRLEARTALFPLEAARGETFPLVAGELSNSAGEAVLIREVKEARALLAPRGQALLLAPKKSGEAIVNAGAGFSLLLERGPFSVWRG